MPDWFLNCKHCGEHLGSIQPKRDGQYRVTGYEYTPYALKYPFAPDTRALGSLVRCHKCGKDTPLTFPEEGTP